VGWADLVHRRQVPASLALTGHHFSSGLGGARLLPESAFVHYWLISYVALGFYYVHSAIGARSGLPWSDEDDSNDLADDSVGLRKIKPSRRPRSRVIIRRRTLESWVTRARSIADARD